MTPIRRGDTWYLYVQKQKGGVVLRTTGTTEKRLYTLMKALLARLKADRRWPLLNAIVDGRLSIGAVFDADRVRGLDALEASLSAQRLDPHATAYLATCQARGLAPRNLENIERQLGSFLAGGDKTTADLTTANVTAWLAGLTTSPGTRRQYLYAVTGFTRYLVDVGVLADYPLSRVKAPKKNPARIRYESAENDERIVRAARLDVQGLFAFVKGTGVDLTVAIDTPAREIRLAEQRARLRGTKTAQRDVHDALIEPWSIPYIARDLAHVLPNVKPWGHLTRSMTAKQHERACEAVGIDGYTLKDARHSVAVRMAKAGYTVFEIAEQLGNSPELVARVYARFIVKMERRVTQSVTEAVR